MVQRLYIMKKEGFKMTIRERMVDLFKKHGTLTDYEITKSLNIQCDTARTVRLFIERKGIIKRTANKRTTPENGLYTIFEFVKDVEIKQRGKRKIKTEENKLEKLSKDFDYLVEKLEKLLGIFCNKK